VGGAGTRHRGAVFLNLAGPNGGLRPWRNAGTPRSRPITVATTAAAEFEKATYGKVAWHVIPFLFLCYIVAFLDRVNVGFAKLQMAPDLGFSDAIYGFGAGLFFIGYFIFEVPSNLLLERIGARVWIARIMITWGVVSAAFVFTPQIHWGSVAVAFKCTDPEFTFYVLRFLLGVGESARDARNDVTEAAAWTIIATTILNLDEAVTRG
jgi:MFS family permease